MVVCKAIARREASDSPPRQAHKASSIGSDPKGPLPVFDERRDGFRRHSLKGTDDDSLRAKARKLAPTAHDHVAILQHRERTYVAKRQTDLRRDVTHHGAVDGEEPIGRAHKNLPARERHGRHLLVGKSGQHEFRALSVSNAKEAAVRAHEHVIAREGDGRHACAA